METYSTRGCRTCWGESEIYKILPSFALIPVKTDTGWAWLSRVYWIHTATCIVDTGTVDTRTKLLYNKITDDMIVARDFSAYPVKKHDYLVMKLNGELDGKL